MKANLTIKDLTLEKHRKIVLNNISIKLEGGNIYALLGCNGAGKTTLLKSIVGLEPLATKSVLFNEIPIYELNKFTRAKKFSFLPQHSVIQLYCLAKYRIAHGLIPNFGFGTWLNENQTERIYEIANQLCIHHLLDRQINLMSGGEQRLVHIAKSMVNPNIELLLLDEPSVFLDFGQKEILAKSINNLKHPSRVIIFSSHDSSFISSCANKILSLENGDITITDLKN